MPALIFTNAFKIIKFANIKLCNKFQLSYSGKVWWQRWMDEDFGKKDECIDRPEGY